MSPTLIDSSRSLSIDQIDEDRQGRTDVAKPTANVPNTDAMMLQEFCGWFGKYCDVIIVSNESLGDRS